MEILKVELGDRSYEIRIERECLSGLGATLKPMGFSPRMALITNDTVFGIYGKAVHASLKQAGFEVARPEKRSPSGKAIDAAASPLSLPSSG